MDLSNDARTNEGRPIQARKGADGVLAYEQWINDSNMPNLKGQTFTIGFNSRRLIEWLHQNGDNMDTVQIYLTLDEEQKLNVVLWPYNAGLPSVIQQGKQGGATLSAPYNIGGRRP